MLLFHISIKFFQNFKKLKKNLIMWVLDSWIGSTKKNKSVEPKQSLLSQKLISADLFTQIHRW